MLKAKIICNRNFIRGETDPRIYGSFLEHMGRVIYTGIYEPGHNTSDEDGFRKDVLKAVRNMGVSTVRYPGGNFVSTYHWEDGIGPKEMRPRRPDLAWRAIETNQFGTEEFIRWCRKAGVHPIFTVNLGTRGMEDALHYLEYCNFPEGTQYSELRIKNGTKEPYRIKTWCLGNEMDGQWQIGHKGAHEYGRLAAETGKAMKRLDPSIELIVSGSSLSTMPSFPKWDLEVLDDTYEVADYLSLHQYYGGQENGTKEFLAQSLDMQNYISTVRAAAQYVKRKHHSKKDMKFSMDEWGVWAVSSDQVNEEVSKRPWQIAPAISEQIYTMEDALLFAEMLMVILRNTDSIKIACQSLLTNVSACIMTEPNGGIWLQTIYYPFCMFAKYAIGTVLEEKIETDTYDCKEVKNVPYLDSVIVYNRKQNELEAFLVNRSETEEITVDIDCQNFSLDTVVEGLELVSKDKKATNKENHNEVIPQINDDFKMEQNTFRCKVKPLSFNMFRIHIK